MQVAQVMQDLMVVEQAVKLDLAVVEVEVDTPDFSLDLFRRIMQ